MYTCFPGYTSYTAWYARFIFQEIDANLMQTQYTVMDNFDALVQFGPDGTEREPETGHGSIHVNHCFEYLRQVILCNMDSTLEGATVDNAHGTSGWSVSHTCRSYERARAWAESFRQTDTQFLLHETESRIGNGGVRPGAH
jgi:hypothetical protein